MKRPMSSQSFVIWKPIPGGSRDSWGNSWGARICGQAPFKGKLETLRLEWVQGRWKGTFLPALSGPQEIPSQLLQVGLLEAGTSSRSWGSTPRNYFQGETGWWEFLPLFSEPGLGWVEGKIASCVPDIGHSSAVISHCFNFHLSDEIWCYTSFQMLI